MIHDIVLESPKCVLFHCDNAILKQIRYNHIVQVPPQRSLLDFADLDYIQDHSGEIQKSYCYQDKLKTKHARKTELLT